MLMGHIQRLVEKAVTLWIIQGGKGETPTDDKNMLVPGTCKSPGCIAYMVRCSWGACRTCCFKRHQRQHYEENWGTSAPQGVPPTHSHFGFHVHDRRAGLPDIRRVTPLTPVVSAPDAPPVMKLTRVDRMDADLTPANNRGHLNLLIIAVTAERSDTSDA